jgi:hypothetical protein
MALPLIPIASTLLKAGGIKLARKFIKDQVKRNMSKGIKKIDPKQSTIPGFSKAEGANKRIQAVKNMKKVDQVMPKNWRNSFSKTQAMTAVSQKFLRGLKKK